jgi:hypothetical protein
MHNFRALLGSMGHAELHNQIKRNARMEACHKELELLDLWAQAQLPSTIELLALQS